MRACIHTYTHTYIHVQDQHLACCQSSARPFQGSSQAATACIHTHIHTHTHTCAGSAPPMLSVKRKALPGEFSGSDDDEDDKEGKGEGKKKKNKGGGGGKGDSKGKR
jgi:hypothetical protein